MTSARAARTLLFAPLLLAGCVSIAADGRREGAARPVLDSWRLEVGRTTLARALASIGPPDLILRVGDTDRAYYVAWDSIFLKLVVSVPLPFGGRSFSTDAFILGVGSEEIRLVRMEFDRAGVLRDLQRAEFSSFSNGESVAIDNHVVEEFLEDRARALSVREEEDDDADPKE